MRVLEFLTDSAFVDACIAANVPMSYYIENSDGSGRRLFNLPVQLMAHQNVRRKKFMEPFSRRNKDLKDGGIFRFGYDDCEVDTNVAQLQFLRFLVENHVLSWVRKHKDMIFRIKSQCNAAANASNAAAGSAAGTTATPAKRRRLVSSSVWRDDSRPVCGVDLTV